MMMEQHCQPYEEGSILENTPKHGPMDELILELSLSLAEDRGKWRLDDQSMTRSVQIRATWAGTWRDVRYIIECALSIALGC